MKLNSYICFYKGKKLEIEAETSYQAQGKAAKQFKAKKVYQVTVMLAEIGGEQVIHSTASI